MLVTCQYTGIQFEAKSARTKNHPEFSKLMTEAHRLGIYDRYMRSVEKAKSSATPDNPMTIDRAKAGLEKIHKNHLSEQDEQRKKDIEFKNTIAAAKAKREAQNAHLRAHGYTWHKASQDDVDDGFANDADWHLLSNDGREVSVKQALDEIERGREVVLAEIAQAEAQAEAAAKAKRSANELRTSLATLIEDVGEKPEGDHDLDGEVLCDTGTIYGTGSWFVATQTHIWFVKNNGMDGDDWQLNNVRTGGAGGIGYRINRTPATEYIISHLREINALTK